MVSETTSSAAISAFDSPRAISLKTSSSRGVSSSSYARRALLRHGPARELVDQPLGDRRREQRVALRDHADAVHELLRRHVLQQEAARARAQGVVDVLVEVEGGEHEHARPLALAATASDQTRGLDPVHLRHSDVHEDDVGLEAPHAAHGPGRRPADRWPLASSSAPLSREVVAIKPPRNAPRAP